MKKICLLLGICFLFLFAMFFYCPNIGSAVLAEGEVKFDNFFDFEQAIINFSNEDEIVETSSTNDNKKKSAMQDDYKLKRIILKGDLKNAYGAINVYSYNDLHILCYKSEAETEYAYIQLKECGAYVTLDRQCSPDSGYSDKDYDYSANPNWGAGAIEIGGYLDYLNNFDSEKEIVVAVLDTGINTSHEMFEDRFLLDDDGKIVGYSYGDSTYQYSYDDLAFEDGDTNKYSFEDDLGHGSHVAGIICSLTPKNVKILPIKISYNNKGSSSTTIVLSAYERIIQVYSQKYNIVCTNFSYTGGGKDSEGDRDVFNQKCYEPLLERNILPVISAGNKSKRIDMDGILSVVVSSVGKTEGGYAFADDHSDWGTIVDISAPGCDINSAYIMETDASGSPYKEQTGTSMATPQVSGVVALLALHPHITLTAEQMEQKLYSLAVDLGDDGYDIYYGNGMVNLKNFDVYWSVVAGSSENGTISPSGEVVLMDGEDKLFNFTPSDGYIVSKMLVDNVAISDDLLKEVMESGYIFENISQNHTIFVIFDKKSYTITYKMGKAHLDDVIKTYKWGDEIVQMDGPEYPDHDFMGWYLDEYFDEVFNLNIMPEENIVVWAKWRRVHFTISVSCSDGGFITPEGENTVNYGSAILFSFLPDLGYHVKSIVVDNSPLSDEEMENIKSVYGFINIISDHTLVVIFEINTYTITVNIDDGNKTVHNYEVRHGDNKKISLGFDARKYNVSATTNGKELILNGDTIELENVMQNESISVVLTKKNSNAGTIIAISVLLALAVGAVLYFVIKSRRKFL